jgi:hypothetical protein
MAMNFPSINGGDMKDLVQVGATVASTVIAIIALWRQRKQAERLKMLESELDKAKFEHQTIFTRLHEKRAEVIAELYRRIVVIELWVQHVVSETGIPETFVSVEAGAEYLDRALGHISINQQDLAGYFNLNRLYLDAELCDKLVDFHDIILNKIEPIEGYFFERFGQMTKEAILEHYGDNLEERAEKVLEHVADSRRALEAEFRHLLGMQSRVNNRHFQYLS